MNCRIFLLAGLFIIAASFAHQQQLVDINGTEYLLVGGPLTEPFYTDENSGAIFYAYVADPSDPLNEEKGTPVLGLEKTMKVELQAGNKTKTLDLETLDSPGQYVGRFFPTVPTTMTFRFFGTINGTPVDLSYVSGGSESDPAVTKDERLSDSVVRKVVAGGFMSPASVSDDSFPEPYVSDYEISTALGQLDGRVSQLENPASGGQKADPQAVSSLPVILSVAAIIIAFVAIIYKRQ